MAGRPTIYTEEIAELVCETTATSTKSLKTVCEEHNLKVMTVLCWLCETHSNYIEAFAKMYARAKEMQADYLAEEILEISDDSSNDTLETKLGPIENKEWVNRSKLRVDARKWIASKLKPKKYGDKVQTELSGPDGGAIQASGMNILILPPGTQSSIDIKQSE